MESPRIRTASSHDAPDISRLLGQLGYPSEASAIPHRLERVLARPGTTVLVAEVGGSVVGVVTVHLFQALHTEEPNAWLTAVVVDESARGKGIGSALVASAEDWAREHGATRLSLTSALRRKEAHQFYKTRDYEHTGVRLSKDLSRQPAIAAAAATKFHVLEFAHHDEAAHFVAELSRFLDSPDAGAQQTRAEVWARSPVRSESVRLFLNDHALEAARKAFSPIPSQRSVGRDALPDESFLIIQAGVTPAWGAAEAATRLSPVTRST
jgi:GNAT superfamily N-acetyltransferase